MGLDNYELNTKAGYTRPEKVLHYHHQMTKGFTWARLMMSRETAWVGKMLKLLSVQQDDEILDVPCGTGILSSVLNKFAIKVFCVDISMAMMRVAREQYSDKRVSGFFQADITQLPFNDDAFKYVVVLGLMHRLPRNVRRKALQELFRVTRNYIIVSYSVDSYIQKLKRKLILLLKPNRKFAPNIITIDEVNEDFNMLNITVRKTISACPILSTEKLFLLEKI